MRFFWKRFADAHQVKPTADEMRMAEMLEAYTCWLKNEKLTRKQKRLMKELPSAVGFPGLKQIVDFVHYQFEERATVTPRPGAQESARARILAEIRGEATEPAYAPVGMEAPGYSPQQTGSEYTDVLPPITAAPTEDELNRWNVEPPAAAAERAAKPFDTIRTLSRMHLRFEQKDDDVYVTDLGGSGATYVEGERVEKTAAIHDDATVACGKVTLKVVNIKRS